ncbi:MAG: PhzF family phenazine biosynthesis protein [Flavihumibacter sp.]
MLLPIYIADAFTDRLFGGNPAAVIPLETWLPDTRMQAIAMENNLSETVFFVKEGNGFRIRWFTPATEVKLCGHATLASAHILYTELGYMADTIHFDSLSGPLTVRQSEQGITLDFPANPPEETDPPAGLFDALKIAPALVFKSSFDYMVLLDNQGAIEALQPDFSALAKIPARGVICTAKGNKADFVSRCFYPQSGINEDPVTGSAHTVTVPFWATQLNKNILQAEQLSARGGQLRCEWQNDRVLMTGTAVTYLKGSIEI